MSYVYPMQVLPLYHYFVVDLMYVVFRMAQTLAVRLLTQMGFCA